VDRKTLGRTYGSLEDHRLKEPSKTFFAMECKSTIEPTCALPSAIARSPKLKSARPSACSLPSGLQEALTARGVCNVRRPRYAASMATAGRWRGKRLLICNQGVAGSNPAAGTNEINRLSRYRDLWITRVHAVRTLLKEFRITRSAQATSA